MISPRTTELQVENLSENWVSVVIMQSQTLESQPIESRTRLFMLRKLHGVPNFLDTLTMTTSSHMSEELETFQKFRGSLTAIQTMGFEWVLHNRKRKQQCIQNQM